MMGQFPGLLERIGREEGCRHLAEAFYSRVAGCAELKPLFPGKTLRCATKELAAFLIQFLEGDPSQTQARWWLGLRESHARFQVSPDQRAAWLRLMSEALAATIDDAGTRTELDQFFVAASTYVLGWGDAAIESDELAAGWDRQICLDQLVQALAAQRDDACVELARSFENRPEILVGILARMMEAGRPSLLAYASDAVRRQQCSAESEFNGRSLLHHAAGSACLTMVQRLLAAGADPNATDQSGHPPLYRAAGVTRFESSAEVVRALLDAGARVNSQSGVNRVTALHEAARRGNTPVLQVLLDAGADRGLVDRNGLTALARAVNCRQRAATELLASWTRLLA